VIKEVEKYILKMSVIIHFEDTSRLLSETSVIKDIQQYFANFLCV